MNAREDRLTRQPPGGHVQASAHVNDASTLPAVPAVPAVGDVDYPALFRAHYGRVVRWLTVLGVARADVDDVAQEVFLVAHRRLGQLRDGASTTGWLLGIARRVAATARRGRGRAERRAAEAEPPADPIDPEAAALRNEGARLVHAFACSLPEEQRLVFVLYELDGASAGEIADAFGTSINTVHARVRLIREKFQRLVQRERARHERTGGAPARRIGDAAAEREP